MNVWIARDGEQIGDYPREQLDRMAQAKELQKTDHYWHDGMENWRQLDELLGAQAWEPPPRPSSPVAPFRILAGAIGAALVLIIAIVAFFASRHTAAPGSGAPAVPKPSVALVGQPDPIRNDRAARDNATRALVEKLSRLPSSAAPPSYTYYSSLALGTPEPPSPLVATISGVEDVVDPATDTVTWHISFTLTADFRHGEWFYTGYRASKTDVRNNNRVEVEDGPDTPMPPSLVSILGLQTRPR